MSKNRVLLFRIGAVAALVLLAVLMLIIGRGHTIYFDNKPIEGSTIECPYKVEVFVKDESAGKLYEGERGMASWMGQTLKVSLKITETKGGDAEVRDMKVKLPYNMDGIVLNIPALLAGESEDVYLSKFVPAVVEEPTEEETVVDEFGDMADF